MFENSFIKDAILEGNGLLYPILIPFSEYSNKGTSIALMNPSVYNDNGAIKAVVRCVNYVFTESLNYSAWCDPIQYLHGENDVRLRTENYIVEFNNDYSVKSYKYVEMQNLHEPNWDFWGLEDARLFRWNGKLYMCGCRRDIKDNGESRMELSEIEEHDNCYKEVSRVRIPMYGDNTQYAEKNWMPILDNPYNWMRWINPTEIITYDISNNITYSNIDGGYYDFPRQRGGTHVVRYKDYYICFAHTVDLWRPYAGNKNSEYFTLIALFDKNFNLIKQTNEFHLNDTKVEFVCGLALKEDKLILSYGYNDNVAYICEFDVNWLINKLY